MIGLLVGLIFVCLLAYLLFYALNTIPLPRPVKVIATVLFVLIVVVAIQNYFPLPQDSFLH
jgi:hypothetical protein